MASERQVLLSIIVVLLCLFVVREISTLSVAEKVASNHWAQIVPDNKQGNQAVAFHDWKRPPAHLPTGVRITPLVAPPDPYTASLAAADVVFSAQAQRVPEVLSTSAAPERLSLAEVMRAAALAEQKARAATDASASTGKSSTAFPSNRKEKAGEPNAPKKASSIGRIGGAGLAKKRHGGGGSEATESKVEGKVSGTEKALPVAAAAAANGGVATASGPGGGGGLGGGLPFAGVTMCYDVSESYGAAWIIHKKKFLRTGFGPPWTEPFDPLGMATPGWSIANNVTFRSVNMEGATHLVLKLTRGAFKTVDAFDFMVEHLSIYERRLGLLHLPDRHRGPLSRRVIKVMQKRERALRVGWSLGADAGLAERAPAAAAAAAAATSAALGPGGAVEAAAAWETRGGGRVAERDHAGVGGGGGLEGEDAAEDEVRGALAAIKAGAAWGGEPRGSGHALGKGVGVCRRNLGVMCFSRVAAFALPPRARRQGPTWATAWWRPCPFTARAWERGIAWRRHVLSTSTQPSFPSPRYVQ